MSDWTKMLQASLVESAEKVPRGWKTANQIRIELGKGKTATGNLLAKWVRAKKAERQNFKIKTGQRVLPVPHYRRVGRK